jgi:hypothetical protein
MPSNTILIKFYSIPLSQAILLRGRKLGGRERLTSDEQIKILALASRAGQNRHFLQSLRSVQTPQEAMKVIFDWEASNEFSPSKLS